MCTPHLRSQLLQRAELQLLHRSFAFPKRLRNLANTPLLNETPKDYAPLVCGKFFHEAKQPGLSLHRLLFRSAARFCRLAPRTFPLIRERVRRDTEKPGPKRSARPRITFQVRQRLVKNLGSQILRLVAVAQSPSDTRINGRKVNFIQVPKFRRVFLRSL